MTETLTSNGITHRKHKSAFIEFRRAEYQRGQQFMWYACEEAIGVLGFADDPPREVTCLMCLALGEESVSMSYDER